MSHKKQKQKFSLTMKFLKNASFLGIAPRTFLYLVLVSASLLTFTMKIEELNSAEIVNIQIALLDLETRGYN